MAKILRYNLFLLGQAFSEPSCTTPTVTALIFYGIIDSKTPNPPISIRSQVCPNGAAFTWNIAGYPPNPTGFVGTPSIVREFLDASCENTDQTIDCVGEEGNICCLSKSFMQSICDRLR